MENLEILGELTLEDSNFIVLLFIFFYNNKNRLKFKLYI